jgi:hypothetical protein
MPRVVDANDALGIAWPSYLRTAIAIASRHLPQSGASGELAFRRFEVIFDLSFLRYWKG